jgi:hypothetical protein
MSEEKRMKNMFKKTMLIASCAAALGGVNTTVQAANWLMIQGAERHGTAGRAKVWGFIQAQYQYDNSDPNGAGGYIPPKMIGPDLDSQSAFNVNRARIGLRGTGMPIDPNVNYFFLVEFGNNAITAPGSGFAKVTDASITLNHLKEYARVRAGQFKIPMSEEVYQGIALIDYVNFTDGVNQMLLERVPNRAYTGNTPPQPIGSTTSLNGFNQSIDAARDVGVQVFNTFKVNPDWEASYSFMVGNGNGINSSDNDNNKDYHLYFSASRVFSGSGPKRQDWKTYAWYTTGDRTIDASNDMTSNPLEYERKRYGVGTRYFKLPFRVSAEWIKAEGVIFQGPDKPSFGLGPANSANDPTSPASGLNPDAEASQWSIEGGYFIPNTKWELDLRYSLFTRMEDSIAEFEFKDLTVGVQYHFNKKTRLTVNLQNRDVEATAFGASAGPNANLKDIDKRFAVQLTHIF